MSAFTKTLCVGAAAAASLPLGLAVLGPAIGGESALALHAVLSVAVYLAALATGTRRRLGVFAAACGLGGAAASLSASWTGLALLLGAVVAVIRAGWLLRRGWLRSLAVEAVVLVVATATLALLVAWAPPGPAGFAVASWGWFVAQSLGVLIGGGTALRARSGDPFEEAARRLEALLDAP